jgi:hypothetical protein
MDPKVLLVSVDGQLSKMLTILSNMNPQEGGYKMMCEAIGNLSRLRLSLVNQLIVTG